MRSRTMFSFLCKTPLKPFHQSSSPLFSTTTTTTRFISSTFHHHRRVPDPSTPTSATYDQLITTAGRSKDFTTIQNLLNQRYKDGSFNTTQTFKFITDQKNPNPKDPSLNHLIETLSRLDKGFATKNAFDCLIARLCKHNLIEETESVISKMFECGGCGINAITFHPLLSTLTRTRRYEDAWRVLEMMRDHGIKIDVTAYNFILTSHCYQGNLQEAAKVLEKMILEEGLEGDGRTYDAMVMGACKVGKVEGALMIWRRMAEAKIPVMFSSYGHVIKGLMRLGFVKQAMEFVVAVGGKKEGLDSENFGYLGSLLVRGRKVKEAKLVFGEIDKRGLKVEKKLRGEYESLVANEKK